jgi:hypothetical protein
MAVGAPDPNGIYQYTEDDLASPFSDTLNKLAGTTSTKVAALAAGITKITAKVLEASEAAAYTGTAGQPLILAGPSLVLTPGKWLLKAGVTVRNATALDYASCGIWNASAPAELARSRGSAGQVQNTAQPVPLESRWTYVSVSSNTQVCPVGFPNGATALATTIAAGSPTAWITAQFIGGL